MDDRAIERRIERLEGLLDQLEGTPGPTAATALEAVASLTAVYGEALRRVMERIDASPGLAEELAADALVGHLLLLHDLHPDPLPKRLERALDEIRPYVHSHGGRVELVGVEDGVATVRMSGSCDGCTASSATLEAGIKDALLAAAPELVDVVGRDDGGAAHPPPMAPALIPLEAIRAPARVRPS